MSVQHTVNADKIQIAAIRTIKGNIDGNAAIDAGTISGHQFEFELNTGLDPEANVVGLQLVVNITAQDSNEVTLDLKGSYTHEIIFIVEDLAGFLKKSASEENGFLIDGMLGSTLVSIAYSTVRGIIFTRTQGTSLGSVILPVIDPKKLMNAE